MSQAALKLAGHVEPDAQGQPGEQAPVHHVLAVGERSLQALVAQAAGQLQRSGQRLAVRAVDTWLMALGEAWQTRPRVVVARLSTLDPTFRDTGTVRSMTSALRRLAPEARLLVVATSDHEDAAVRAMNAGVDDYLLEPAGVAAMAGLLRTALGLPADAACDAALADGLTSPSGQSDSSAADSTLPDSPTPLREEDELGDIDLIERLLDGRRGLHRLAVQLIGQRSGDTDLEWSARESEVPDGHLRAAVRLRGESLGWLHRPHRPDDSAQAEDDLSAWAAWLARWLALEAHLDRLTKLAYRDELTGVWNRRYFQRFLEQTLAEATHQRKQVTVMVFDIDDFKLYNDEYGHGAGDDILRETARLMQSVVRPHDVVARIGGDEFAVIFWDPDGGKVEGSGMPPVSASASGSASGGGVRHPGSTHPSDVVAAAQRFQRAICAYKFPRLIDEVSKTVTISGGLATFPWDGRTPADLLELADQMALRSKQQGKNAITFGPGATRLCVPDSSEARRS